MGAADQPPEGTMYVVYDGFPGNVRKLVEVVSCNYGRTSRGYVQPQVLGRVVVAVSEILEKGTQPRCFVQWPDCCALIASVAASSIDTVVTCDCWRIERSGLGIADFLVSNCRSTIWQWNAWPVVTPGRAP